MRAFYLAVFASMIVLSVSAQKTDTIKYWKKSAFTSLQFNQVGLTNWAAGGENALSFTVIGNVTANYLKDKTTWDNTLDMGYGLLKSSDNPFRKNEDKIELNSKYGKLAKGKFYYSGLLNFKTQFAPGYNYPNDSVVVSRLMAPGYLTAALGFDYKPNKFFTCFISPASGKFTFVMDQQLANLGSYGVQKATYDTSGNVLVPGKRLKPEFGAYLKAKYQKDITKEVNLMTTLNLFNNYTDKDPGNRKNIDVDWQTRITMKSGKYLVTSLFTHVIYDHNIQLPTYKTINGEKVQTGKGPKTQFKEVFGVGFSYKF